VGREPSAFRHQSDRVLRIGGAQAGSGGRHEGNVVSGLSHVK
jgi:hypothetical protein